MELTVLGKYGPYGKPGGGCASGYLVQNGEDRLVLDMGSGTMARLIGLADIRRINGIFISHLHYDHTSDLLPLRYLLEEKEHTVTIYTHYEDSDWYRILFQHPNFHIVNIDADTNIRCGSMQLSFIPMQHTVPSFAVRIQGDATLCYTADTVYNDNIPLCFQHADAVLADCSKPSGFHGPHMTIDRAKELAKQYPKTTVIATHQSADYDPKDDFTGFSNLLSAEEMQTYKI